MRWKTAMKGDTRIRRRFLLFPRQIGGEVRWLEWGEWEEEHAADYGGGFWVAKRWRN